MIQHCNPHFLHTNTIPLPQSSMDVFIGLVQGSTSELNANRGHLRASITLMEYAMVLKSPVDVARNTSISDLFVVYRARNLWQ